MTIADTDTSPQPSETLSDDNIRGRGKAPLAKSFRFRVYFGFIFSTCYLTQSCIIDSCRRRKLLRKKEIRKKEVEEEKG